MPSTTWYHAFRYRHSEVILHQSQLYRMFLLLPMQLNSQHVCDDDDVTVALQMLVIGNESETVEHLAVVAHRLVMDVILTFRRKLSNHIE